MEETTVDPLDAQAEAMRDIVAQTYFLEESYPEVVLVIHPTSSSYPTMLRPQDMLSGVFEGSVTYPCSRREFSNMIGECDQDIAKQTMTIRNPQIAILFGAAHYLFEIQVKEERPSQPCKP